MQELQVSRFRQEYHSRRRDRDRDRDRGGSTAFNRTAVRSTVDVRADRFVDQEQPKIDTFPCFHP